jgi:uncharacterized protein
MSRIYHEGNRELQDRFDSRRLADRLEQVKVHSTFTNDDIRFIQQQDMFFLATADAQGQPNCSYKGGSVGFAQVIDERTLVFPSYDGNGMFLSVGNLSVNPAVGMLFVDFSQQKRLRVNGTAAWSECDPLMASYPGAQLVVRVTARQIFPNCPRYIHEQSPIKRSEYVPEAGVAAPIPAWKQAEWARDVLPYQVNPSSEPG